MAPSTEAALDSGCYGILFEDSRPEGVGDADPRDFLRDLHLDLQLDQVMTTLVEGNNPYWLRPLFCSPLSDPALLTLRQGILDDLGDLDDAGLDGVLMAFSHGLLRGRETTGHPTAPRVRQR